MKILTEDPVRLNPQHFIPSVAIYIPDLHSFLWLHRSAQVNVRLTPEEKAALESKAKAKGFRGLSDFIRTTVLTEK